MAVRWAISSGAFSSTATWNNGGTLGIPTTGDDVFTNGFTVTMDVNATVNSMSNSARARDIATPAMTANNIPSPYVAGGNLSGGGAPFQAFDRNTSTNWGSGGGFGTAGILSMDFGSGNSIIINGYTIIGINNAGANPFSWILQGSADSISWINLHTVNTTVIPASGSYSIASIGNTTDYRYYRLNITANNGANFLQLAELELYEPGTAALAAGGSFNFNTAGVSVNISSSIGLNLATNLPIFTVTATSGLVTISSPLVSWTVFSSNSLYLTNAGNCDLTITAIQFAGFRIDSAGSNSGRCIEKTGSGTLTLNGNVLGQGGFRNSGNHGVAISNGNLIVNGNVTGGFTTSTGGANYGISMTAGGSLTINGNVIGGVGHTSNAVYHRGSSITVVGNVTNLSTTPPGVSTNAIDTTATMSITGNVTGGIGGYITILTTNTLTINGNVIGGVGAAISTTNTLTITGNVIAGAVNAITSTSANTINVTGDVYASATANGISSTSGVVNLTGNMYNGLGRNAIYCPNVFISNTATTLWRMDTGGGNYKFLYSADTTPNLPPITDVRFGTTFGPALSLTGTMVVLANSDVRKDVPNDNSVGTAELTSADIISGINASSDPLAVRLKNALTDVTAGNIISQYKDS